MSETTKFVMTTIISAIGVLVPILAYFILTGKYKEKISNNEKNITELKADIKSLNTELKADIKSLNTELKADIKSLNTEFKTDIKSLNNNMQDIPWRIMETLGGILGSKEMKAASLTVMKSPISLSEKGESVADKIKADEIIAAHKETLLNKVEEKKPITAYQKQEKSKEVINQFLIQEIISNDEKIFLEDFAYNEGFDMEDLLIIFSIKLRDIVLKEDNHSHEKVDETNPTVT